MIRLKTKEEIELIRESALLVGKTLAEVGKYVKPGVTTAFLDKIGEQFIRDNGATPVFKGYNGFPAALCISVNDVVVHGIPSEDMFIKEGDIVSIDCGTNLNGYIGDSAYTFTCGEVRPEVLRLLKVTKEALYLGLEKCVEGNRVGDIGHAIQTHCEKNGYTVVRELCGHGVGIRLHEDPSVSNFGVKGTGPLLKEGMVIAVEPMINLGSKNVKFSQEDGWTCRTKDGKPSAHFEHDVAIGKHAPDILSSFEPIENIK
ncbi:MAG: type I methionyl aminopeptidase [Bacteroidales bacterium]|jgi:methionyl aminopeptidase|nr:type I methionyl aminopeptidase [Bacteroidales bacterium]